jgi:hypothetical protein
MYQDLPLSLNTTITAFQKEIFLGDQIKYEMGRTCSIGRGGERCIQGFGGEALGKETT